MTFTMLAPQRWTVGSEFAVEALLGAVLGATLGLVG